MKIKKMTTIKDVLEMCIKCYAFKYDNEWHFEKPEHLIDRDPDERIPVQFSQCTSCIEESLEIHDMDYA